MLRHRKATQMSDWEPDLYNRFRRYRAEPVAHMQFINCWQNRPIPWAKRPILRALMLAEGGDKITVAPALVMSQDIHAQGFRRSK